MKKQLTQILALTMSLALLLTATGALASAQAPAAPVETMARQESSSSASAGKTETVYVLADASGRVRKVIVSDWLKNPQKASSLSEYSLLGDVVNVKGDETYTLNPDHIRTWQADGQDIYYQAETEEPLPVEVSVTYKLDGKLISPQELAGKSGRVTMTFSYQNRQKETVAIHGRNEEIYVPFVMATGLVLDNSVFRNVEINNGKLLNDGNRTVAIGLALPGWRDSLGLGGKELGGEIPDTVEISADAENFSLLTTLTIAFGDLMSDMDWDNIHEIGELEDSLNQLSDASQKLVDGSAALYGGLRALSEKSGELAEGVDKLVDGSQSVTQGAGQLADGTGELSQGAEKLYQSAGQLVAGLKEARDGADAIPGGTAQLTQGADSLSGGLESVSGGIEKLSDGIGQTYASLSAVIAGQEQLIQGLEAAAAAEPGLQPIVEGLKTSVEKEKLVAASMAPGNQGIADAATALQQGTAQLLLGAKDLKYGVGSLSQGALALQDGLNRLYDGSGALYQGLGDLQSAGKSLDTGAQALKSGSQELAGGCQALKAGSAALLDGIAQLESGSGDLKEGMNEFSQNGVQKLLGAYRDDISPLIDRLKAMTEVSRHYRSFTGDAENPENSVKFIFKTDEIGK